VNNAEKRQWWEMTALLAWTGSALCLLVVAGAMAGAAYSGSLTVLAMPAATFLAVIATPAFLAAVVFLHASRQALVDRNANAAQN
jgi:hypothetical protein